MKTLAEVYDRFMQTGSGPDSNSIDWEAFHLATQDMLEQVVFQQAECFHDLAKSDTNLKMPPFLRLFGYRNATLTYPDNLDYAEAFLWTLQFYYPLEKDAIDEMKKRIEKIKLTTANTH